MTVPARYQADVDAVLATRHENGADHWATPDGRLAKGGPFSTVEAPRLLLELGVDRDDPVLRGAADALWRAWRPDGRVRLWPAGAVHPCHTINAALTLALLGEARDPRFATTLDTLLAGLHSDGGWRCASFRYGRGPETEASNPGPTLAALDVLRVAGRTDLAPVGAIDLLLGHWVTRRPLGPCHYGIGTLFLQVEYPFAGYNLFHWVHTLSAYARAREDPRFLEALALLTAGLVDGQVVVARVHRRLAGLELCRKGEPSESATARYREIQANLAGA